MTVKIISCSVGILTYNSEKTLRRALESVKDFSDIIISDGGSADSTLAIAKEYGCTVIEQYAKHSPGKDLAHPIEDFSLERNRMVKIAKEDWYYWLDSDEYISHELHEEIAKTVEKKSTKYHAYEIPIVLQSKDASITYDSWKQNYQIRFFNLRTGGRFYRPIHEKFLFDTSLYSTGKLNGAWYVPISKPSFSAHKNTVDYRLKILFADSYPRTFRSYIYEAVYRPVKHSLSVVFRFSVMYIFYSSRNHLPIGYVRNKLYSQWVTFREFSMLYFRKGQ